MASLAGRHPGAALEFGGGLSVPVFLVSFLAMIVTSIHNFLLSDGLEVMGGVGVGFSVLIFVFALGLWLYARAMAQRGVLV